jgi:hypothetical protein
MLEYNAWVVPWLCCTHVASASFYNSRYHKTVKLESSRLGSQVALEQSHTGSSLVDAGRPERGWKANCGQWPRTQNQLVEPCRDEKTQRQSFVVDVTLLLQ